MGPRGIVGKGSLAGCGCKMARWPGSLSVYRLSAAVAALTAVCAVRLCMCSLSDFFAEGEGVAFKNNIFLT